MCSSNMPRTTALLVRVPVGSKNRPVEATAGYEVLVSVVFGVQVWADGFAEAG